MPQDRPKPSSSMWHLLCAYWKDVLWSWDLWLSTLLAILTGVLVTPSPTVLFQVATVEVGVASALVGVILAGLAIITAFLDKRYVAVLAKTHEGVMPEVFHFKLTATAAVASVVFNLAVIIVKDARWLADYRAVALAVSLWLFTYSLFCTLNLISLVGGHLGLRETQVEDELDDRQR